MPPELKGSETDMALQKDKETKQRSNGGVVRLIKITACVVWFLIVLLCLFHRGNFSVQEIAALSGNGGFYAALILLLLFAIKSLSVVLYSGILFAASGLLFPLPWALLVSVVGTIIMVTIPYLFGRFAGKDTIERIARRYRKFSVFSEQLNRTAFFAVLVIRIIGLLPADLVSAYMGASGISYPVYLFASILGILPTAVTFAVMGSSVGDIHSPAFWISLFAEVLLVILSGLLTLRLEKKRHRCEEQLDEKQSESPD